MGKTETMSYAERLFAALEQNPIDRVPCPGLLQTGTLDLMEASGAYWPDAHTDPEKMMKLSWAAYEFAGLEGIRVPFTAYTECEAVGAELHKWKKDNHPMVKKHAIQTPEDVDRLEVPDFRKTGKLSPVALKAVDLLAPMCKKEKLPLTVMVMGPVSIALNSGMINMMNSMIWFKNNPEVIDKLFKKCQDIAFAFSEAAVDAGADVILYNDGLAGTVTPEDYQERFFEGDKNCIRRIRNLGIHVVIHICSDARPVLPYLKELGAHGISIAEMVPMKQAREIVEDSVALVGGCNQLYTLIKKGPEDVMEEAKKAIEDGVDVLAPGCGFGAKTPLKNMQAMVEAAKKYGGNARLARG
ncbi:MAG: MtaA/CmuA family methyltransferase [Candidatus Syntropharchaeia archaeon]